MKTRQVLARYLLLGLWVAGCASEAPRTVQVICQETPVYSTRWGSETPSSVFLGNTFQVTAVALTRRLRITGAQGDSDTARFLEARCVAPYPLQGQARWVQVSSPLKGEGLDPSAPRHGWDLGDEVEVLTVNESWVPSGQSAVLRQGGVVGFIPTTALGDQPPPLARYTEALRAQLARDTFDAALALTRRALRSFPQEALLHRLQGHLVTRSGGTAPKPPKNLPRLAALPDVLADQPLVLSDDEVNSSTPLPVYTTAVGLRLRQNAEPSAKVLATLPMNQPLGLTYTDGDWAEVRFAPGGHQAEMDYDGSFLDFVDAPSHTGYVSLRFLSRAPVPPERWLARGQEALKTGRAAEAIVLLHRALESEPDMPLDPTNAAYMGLIEASFAGERFENLFQAITARQAAKPAQFTRVKPAYPLVVMACHGDLAQAKILDLRDPQTGAWAGLGAAASQMKEPHLCVASVDTRAPVKLRNSCQDGECEQPQKLQKADELYRVLESEDEEWSSKVNIHYDSPSYFYFEPKDLRGFDPGKRLVFYDIPLEGAVIDEKVSGVRLKKSAAHVVVLDLPTPTDWNQFQVWIKVPNYLDSEFGVAIVDDEEQVSEWIQQREDYFEYGPFRVAQGKLPRGFDPRPTSFPVFSYTGLTSTRNYGWSTLRD